MQKIKQHGFTAIEIVLVIALVGVIGVAGYQAWQNMQKAKTQTSSNTTAQKTPEATPAPTVNPTADWLTYANKDYGFSFKYPKDWKLDQVHPNSVPTADDEVLGLVLTPPGSVYDSFTIKVGTSYTKAVDTYKSINLSGSTKITSEEMISRNGVTGLKINSTGGNDLGSWKNSAYFFQRNGVAYWAQDELVETTMADPLGFAKNTPLIVDSITFN